MLRGWVSAARMTSSLVPRLMLHAVSVGGVFGEERKSLDIRLGRLVLQSRLANAQMREREWSQTYSALLELAVVAGLLDAVEQLLDQRGVLGLGPGGRLVLSGRHCGVGGLMVRMAFRIGSENLLSPGFTAVARPGVVWDAVRRECDGS